MRINNTETVRAWLAMLFFLPEKGKLCRISMI